MSVEEFKARKIRVYRNGDTHYVGKRMVVSGRVFKNYEQFLLVVSDEVRLVSGAVRRLVDMETGAPVRSLNDLKDGAFYVASSGEPYKRVAYIVTDENGLPLGVGSQHNLVPMGVQRPSETRQQPRRKVNRSTGGLLDEEVPEMVADEHIFGPTTKAYRVIVFENGEFADPGFRLILNYRNCRSFEQLLRHLSSHMYLKSGQVKKLYDAHTGRRIRYLRDIQPGHNLVAATYEPFKMVPYQFQDLTGTQQVVKKETEAPRIVTFYPNGDSYHTGLTVTVVKKRFPTLTRLIDTLNTQIELVTGKIQKIHALDGSRITSIEELVNGKGYVMVANDDPFIKTRYNVLAIKHRAGGAHTDKSNATGHVSETEDVARESTKTRTASNRPSKTTRHAKPAPSQRPKSQRQPANADVAQTESQKESEPSNRPKSVKEPDSGPHPKKSAVPSKPAKISHAKPNYVPEPKEEPPVSRNALKSPGSIYEETLANESPEKEEVYGGAEVKELKSKNGNNKSQKNLKQPIKQQATEQERPSSQAGQVQKPSTGSKKPKTPKDLKKSDEAPKSTPQETEEKLIRRVASPSPEKPKTAGKVSATVSDYASSKRQPNAFSQPLPQEEGNQQTSSDPARILSAPAPTGANEFEVSELTGVLSQPILQKQPSSITGQNDKDLTQASDNNPVPSPVRIHSKPGTGKLEKSSSRASITKTVSLTFEPPSSENSAAR